MPVTPLPLTLHHDKKRKVLILPKQKLQSSSSTKDVDLETLLATDCGEKIADPHYQAWEVSWAYPGGQSLQVLGACLSDGTHLSTEVQLSLAPFQF